MSNYVVGDRVEIKGAKAKKAQILVIVEGNSSAKTKHFGEGTFYGVRLTVDGEGTTDGRYKNQDPFFFKCPKNSGRFVQAKDIIKKIDDASFDFTNETAEIDAAKARDDERQNRPNNLSSQALIPNQEAAQLSEVKEEPTITHELSEIVSIQRHRRMDVATAMASASAGTSVIGTGVAATAVTIGTGGIALLAIGGALVIGGIIGGAVYGVSKYKEFRVKDKLKTLLNQELDQLRVKQRS